MDQPDIATHPTKPETKHHTVFNKIKLGSATLSLSLPGVDRLVKKREMATSSHDIRRVTTDEEVKKALELEQQVWDEKNYGSLAPYEKYLAQSRIFVAKQDGEYVGVTRIFQGAPELPPFLEELPIDDPNLKQNLIEGCKTAEVEELGTAAIANGAPIIKTWLELCRLAYRDATKRDVKTWGIIMEPPRVNIMNKRYGFTFKQVGPEVDYQGGMCAAHIMDFAEVQKNMSEQHPDYYDWFVNQPIE